VLGSLNNKLLLGLAFLALKAESDLLGCLGLSLEKQTIFVVSTPFKN
jgi:hypothetical protein